MENALDILRRGIVALQSLDDLGSKEANDEAWDKMLVLQQRYDEIMKRYEVVTHTASFDPINDNCPLHPGFMPERMQPPIFDCEFCNEIWDAWKFKGRADRTGRGL